MCWRYNSIKTTILKGIGTGCQSKPPDHKTSPINHSFLEYRNISTDLYSHYYNYNWKYIARRGQMVMVMNKLSTLPDSPFNSIVYEINNNNFV